MVSTPLYCCGHAQEESVSSGWKIYDDQLWQFKQRLLVVWALLIFVLVLSQSKPVVIIVRHKCKWPKKNTFKVNLFCCLCAQLWKKQDLWLCSFTLDYFLSFYIVSWKSLIAVTGGIRSVRKGINHQSWCISQLINGHNQSLIPLSLSPRMFLTLSPSLSYWIFSFAGSAAFPLQPVSSSCTRM